MMDVRKVRSCLSNSNDGHVDTIGMSEAQTKRNRNGDHGKGAVETLRLQLATVDSLVSLANSLNHSFCSSNSACAQMEEVASFKGK